MLLHDVESIIGTVSLLFAYIVSVMFVGYSEAKCASWAGDDTPEQAGFLSADPFVFVDIVGLLLTTILGFGWGRPVPFNPHNATRGVTKFSKLIPKNTASTYKLFTAALVYLSQPFFAAVLVFIALVVNVFLVGPQTIPFAYWGLIGTKTIPFQQLAVVSPYSSSFMLVISMILLAIISFNSFVAVWSFINNTFQYLIFLGSERDYSYMKHADVLVFFGPMIGVIFFTLILQFTLLKFLTSLAYSIAAWCGVYA